KNHWRLSDPGRAPCDPLLRDALDSELHIRNVGPPSSSCMSNTPNSIRKNEEKDHNGFQAHQVRSKTFFQPQNSSIQAQGTTVYFCVSNDAVRETKGEAECKADVHRRGGTSGNSVQHTGQVTVSEGALVTMNCIYTSTGYPTLFWYVQYLSKVCSFFRKRQ
ncbi:hypothetical protein E2I00_003981, partial [Balaenoptera physalus]